MLALLGSVLTASLLGSLHCAGMCGPIAAAATGTVPITVKGRSTSPAAPPASSSSQPTRSACSSACGHRPTLAYHGGRLIVYSTFGTIAGLVGGTFDLAGAMVGVARPAAILAGSLLILSAVIALSAHLGVQTPRSRLGGLLGSVLPRIHQQLAHLTPTRRATAIGVLSGLLPCGWLWAYILLAGATAQPLTGAAVMAVFWTGTVPAVAAASLGLRLLAWPIRRHAPVLSAVAILAIGLLAVSGRVVMPELNRSGKSAGLDDCPLCHDHSPSAKPLPVSFPVPASAPRPATP